MSESTLDYLLDLDGQIIAVNENYFVKFKAGRVEPTKWKPHGISYSLTLHDRYNKRVMGFDNAHAVDPPRKGYSCRKVVEYDHKHRHHLDKGVPYEFTDPGQLVADFWTAVDEYLEKKS